VLLTAIEDSVVLAEAMEARGFGAGRRTSYASRRWSRWDLVVVASAVTAAASFIALRLAGVPVDWYPYPTLFLPPINPVLVLACLALSLPGLARPARGG
jgi:energy-coupling factor transport system permease protein